MTLDCENVAKTEECLTQAQTEPLVSNGTATLTTEQTMNTTLANRILNQFQFQQKTKYLRDMWTQRKVKIPTNHSHMLCIMFWVCVGIACSIAALTTNNWVCDSHKQLHYGLWNSCWKESPVVYVNSIENATIENTTQAVFKKSGFLCAKQHLYSFSIEFVEQWRIDEISASQGLLVCGTLLYVVSCICLFLAYKFINVNNLNSVRNALVMSMFVQIVSFFMQLIGFYMFIFTDRASISITLLFVYFGFAIFATNIINFMTVEYKAYKMRQISI